MTMRRVVTLQPAYLLHQRPYRDSSRIVEMFSRDFGRVALVAKGARRPKSKFRPLLTPFRPLTVSWTIRSSLGTLTDVEPLPHHDRLGAASMLPGFYLNELLLRLLRADDPHGELFGHYAEAVAALATGPEVQSVLRIFEKRLLAAIGYGLNLTHDADRGRPLQASGRYRYQIERGAVLATADDDDAIGGDAFLALAADDLNDRAHLIAARRLLAPVIRHYLGPQPLKTGAVARELRDVHSSDATPGAER